MLNPKYEIDLLLFAEITSKSATSVLFSNLPSDQQVHHSDAMLKSSNSLKQPDFLANSTLLVHKGQASPLTIVRAEKYYCIIRFKVVDNGSKDF